MLPSQGSVFAERLSGVRPGLNYGVEKIPRPVGTVVRLDRDVETGDIANTDVARGELEVDDAGELPVGGLAEVRGIRPKIDGPVAGRVGNEAAAVRTDANPLATEAGRQTRGLEVIGDAVLLRLRRAAAGDRDRENATDHERSPHLLPPFREDSSPRAFAAVPSYDERPAGCRLAMARFSDGYVNDSLLA
jgi:hypothetical protein